MAQYPRGRKKAFVPKNKRKSLKKPANPNVFLLSSLLQASPHYVSGNYLAERLKMSRVGVWARVDKLRKEGLQIEASQNRGYRLAGEPNLLVRPLLEAWLNEIKRACPFYLFDNIYRTNSEAERLLADGRDTPFAVLSHQQKKGRGRLGREWHSPKTGNLYLSIALRPNADLVKLRNFTLWQGISIGKFLKEFTGIEELKVKWPNDLFCGNKKVAGMLTEASINCDQVRSLVLGIGLNVNSNPKSFPPKINDHATSLKNFSGTNWRVHELAAKLIGVCLDASDECLIGDAEEKLFKEWSQFDYLEGKKVRIESGQQILNGKANGIDASGGLLVKLRNGRSKVAYAGEVSLIK
jgi:BirA family biotin operon repressor/biotin-[acetyl-CoA-carboxylase] ligase